MKITKKTATKSTIKMTFDDYDDLELKVSNLPLVPEINKNISVSELEKLFMSTNINLDNKTGYAKHIIPFLTFLLVKIENLPDNEEYEDTIKNINKVMNKYLILE